MIDAPTTLVADVAWRVGALLAAGAGAILAVNAIAANRRRVSPLAERQTRARASLWPRFWVWVAGTSLLVAGAAAGRAGFGLLIALLSSQAAREVAGALRARGIAVSVAAVGIAAPLLVIAAAAWSGAGQIAGAAIASVLLTPLVSAIATRGRGGLPSVAGAIVATLGYVALPLAALAATLGQPNGFAFVSWLLIVVVLSDTFAMFGGLAFGRRPLVPRLSPGKTVEGTVAGFIGAMAGAAIMRFAFPGAPVGGYYAAAIGVAAAGMVGDLFASALKRTAGLKDFSGFLPGHGGLMDRLDSTLLSVPALVLFNRIGAFG